MTQLPLPLLQHSSRDPRAHLNAAVTAVHTRPDLSDSMETTACLFICGGRAERAWVGSRGLAAVLIVVAVAPWAIANKRSGTDAQQQ